MLEETAAGHPGKPALHQPLGGGKYRTYTWSEFRDRVQWTAVGLSTIGVDLGDMVALQSETRAEFYFADLGVMAAGAISAALYTSLPYAEQARALRFCEARVAMVENPKAMQGLQAALSAQESAPALQWVLLTGEAARALEVNPNVLHRWRREFRQGPGNVFPGNGKQRWSEGRIAELERKVGQQALEIDFLKGCLQRIEEQRMLQALTGSPRSTGRSKKK